MEAGLVGDAEWDRFNKKRDRLARLRNTLDNMRFKRSDPEYAAMAQLLETDLGDSVTLSQLAQRQGVDAHMIMRLLPVDVAREISERELRTALADSLYSGYIEKQNVAAARVFRHDNLRVPESFDFRCIGGLSNEMVERLERAKPQNFGQVRRISGLTPVALSTVLVHLTASRSG
jgi:tRNA uridine 5-carboxymethylaminomethyl modification enzyme